ncbi:MAG: hypothetical protein IJO87_04465 [Eggerthellaceae bacterium]|nr:hypothetical protein [Eggerthellaceae bacterium]
MEPIIKETQVIRDHGGWEGNTSSRSKWALGLGIAGTVLGGAALARQGGIGGIVGTGAPSNTVVYTGPATCPGAAFEKECNDILNVTKGMYDLFIVGQQSAAKAREIDVAEKFGLYVNNRDNIDRVNGRINDELFSLYKYTRDKDDETNAKIYDLAQQVAISTAVRPYQDKLIQCKIDEVYTALVNYVDRKTCRLIPGRLVLPSTPTITGYSADCPCPGTAAEAGA